MVSRYVSGRIDREFFVLAPQNNSQWKLVSRILLPDDSDFPLVHSATILKGELITIESDARCDNWRTASYSWIERHNDWSKQSHTLDLESQEVTPRFFYGSTLRDADLVLVTGSHAVRGSIENPKKGIYSAEKLLLEGIVATGVCRLPNDDLLLTAYGQEESPPDTEDETGCGAHKGVAGQLIHVPNALLKS